MIANTLKAYVESLPENKSPKAELRMSSAGTCVRLLGYEQIHGKKPIDFQSYIRMESGTYIHLMFNKLMRLAFGDDFIGSDEEVTLQTPGGIIIPGHPDGEIVSQDAIWEFKSVGGSTFQMIQNQNKPLDDHVTQSNLYAYARKRANVFITVFDMDTKNISEFSFKRDDALAEATLQKFDLAHYQGVNQTLVPRPYTDKTESPCWFCPYKEECYKDFGEEISKAQKKTIADEDLIKMARQYVVTRSTRLIHEKVEEALRADFGREVFTRHNVNECELSDEFGLMTAILVRGKNDNLLTTIKEKRK